MLCVVCACVGVCVVICVVVLVCVLPTRPCVCLFEYEGGWLFDCMPACVYLSVVVGVYV